MYYSYLYCIRAGDYVKIGMSVNPSRRLGSFKNETNTTSCPPDLDRKLLKLEGELYGRPAHERDFHSRFWHERIYGEWYPAGGEAHSAFLGYLENGKLPEVYD